MCSHKICKFGYIALACSWKLCASRLIVRQRFNNFNIDLSLMDETLSPYDRRLLKSSTCARRKLHFALRVVKLRVTRDTFEAEKISGVTGFRVLYPKLVCL